MKKAILFLLVVAATLTACEKNEIEDNGEWDANGTISIVPASYISKETTFHPLPGAPGSIERLGYNEIIKRTTHIHIDGVVFGKNKSLEIPHASVINSNGSLISDAEIYLVNGSDTIAYVPLEIMKFAENKLMDAISKLDYVSANKILASEFVFFHYN